MELRGVVVCLVSEMCEKGLVGGMSERDEEGGSRVGRWGM